MENYQTEQYTAAGLLVGGFTILGTTLGALIGFLIGGGRSEFLNNGWIWTINGLALGSLLSAGLGLLGFAVHVKNHSEGENNQTERNMVAGLLVGSFIILGTALSGFIGFLLGGGSSEFFNNGWIWKVSGLVIGSLLSTGLGLVGLASHVKRNRNHSNMFMG